MNLTIAYMNKAYFRSLYQTFDTIAKEKRYFVRTHAPELRAFKKSVINAIRQNLPLYVAMDGDQVVGWIGIVFPDLPPLSHSGTLVMGVLREYRRQGIGTMLLERAVAHAFAEKHRSRIQLEVLCDNEAARTFYAKHGFRVEGIARRAVFLENEYKDIVHMARLR